MHDYNIDKEVDELITILFCLIFLMFREIIYWKMIY